MVSTAGQKEQEFASRIARRFEADGYRAVNPRSFSRRLPPGYQPDLMFEKSGEVIVVEIKPTKEYRQVDQLRALKQAIEQNPNWHFRLYVPPALGESANTVDNLQSLDERVMLAQELNDRGLHEEAAVTLWMVIEACLRALLTRRQSRPNEGVSGMSMARSLHDFGELDEGELSLLEEAMHSRNVAIHGFRSEPRSAMPSRHFDFARGLVARVQSQTELPPSPLAP